LKEHGDESLQFTAQCVIKVQHLFLVCYTPVRATIFFSSPHQAFDCGENQRFQRPFTSHWFDNGYLRGTSRTTNANPARTGRNEVLFRLQYRTTVVYKEYGLFALFVFHVLSTKNHLYLACSS